MSLERRGEMPHRPQHEQGIPKLAEMPGLTSAKNMIIEIVFLAENELAKQEKNTSQNVSKNL